MDYNKIKNVIDENLPGVETGASNFVITPDETSVVFEVAATDNVNAITKPLSTKAVQMLDPVVKEIEEVTDLSLTALKYKLTDTDAVDKAGIGDIANTVDKMVKLRQLLTGGLTSNVGVMASNISKKIIEQRSELYDD